MTKRNSNSKIEETDKENRTFPSPLPRCPLYKYQLTLLSTSLKNFPSYIYTRNFCNSLCNILYVKHTLSKYNLTTCTYVLSLCRVRRDSCRTSIALAIWKCQKKLNIHIHGYSHNDRKSHLKLLPREFLRKEPITKI